MQAKTSSIYNFPTLHDLLCPGMDLVFFGITPRLYSVERGHYFARRTGPFWPAFSRSRLSQPVRAVLPSQTCPGIA